MNIAKLALLALTVLGLTACVASSAASGQAAQGGSISEIMLGFWHGIIAPVILIGEIIEAVAREHSAVDIPHLRIAEHGRPVRFQDSSSGCLQARRCFGPRPDVAWSRLGRAAASTAARRSIVEIGAPSGSVVGRTYRLLWGDCDEPGARVWCIKRASGQFRTQSNAAHPAPACDCRAGRVALREADFHPRFRRSPLYA